MVTPRDIIDSASRDAGIVGVGQVLLAEDINEGLVRFNRILASNQQRLLNVYRLQDLAFTSTGAQSYSVGAGASFDTGASTQRPSQLHGAYLRDIIASGTDKVDYDMTEIMSRVDYSRIRLKTLSTISSHWFYDPIMPLGLFYPWPVPPATQYEMHILAKQPLTRHTQLSDTMVLPEEYELALQYILAENLCVGYGFPVPDDLKRLVKGSRDTLKGANHRVPIMEMPAEVAGGSRYNIYSDQ